MERAMLESLCKEKEEELLNAFFSQLVDEASRERPETIGYVYTPDLPLKIEAHYKNYLKELWEKHFPDDSRSIDDILDEKKLRLLLTEDDREAVRHAHTEARRRTLWERITKSNHEDVTFYKGLLKEYAQELLSCLRYDFLEETTGAYINNKAFDETSMEK